MSDAPHPGAARGVEELRRRAGSARGRLPRHRRPRSWPSSATTAPASRRSSSASPASTRIDAGEVLFEGEPVNIHGPKDAADLGIEVVYQDLALADNLDVVQNMFLGREEVDRAAALARRDADGEARATRRWRRCRSPRSARCARRWPACPAASASPWRWPRPSCGTRKARDPRRADRGARRGADPPGPRPRQAPGRAGPRRGRDLAQPARHLRGRRQHHGAAPRPERRPSTSAPT